MDRERVPTRILLGTARALAAAAMLAAIASCDGPGILYTLATESPRSNRNLPDEATVTAVVSVGNHFYVAAGGMWRRTHAGENWQPVRRPPRDGSGAGDQLLVVGLAATGDTLCAGTVRGVFRAQAGEAPNWDRASGVPATEQVLRVFTIPRAEDETEILAVTRPREDETAYRVYRSARGCSNFEPLAVQDESGPLFDATFAFDEYWVTVGERLFRGAALDDLEAAAVQPDGSGRLRGVLRNDSGDRLYVADESGRIHVSEDGGSWDSARIEPPGDDADAVPLTRFTQIADTILIGTRGFGFYQFEDGAPDRAQRGPRITSQLYEAHITGFAQFEYVNRQGRRGRIVFAGAAVAGLSSLDIDEVDGNFGTWNWE